MAEEAPDREEWESYNHAELSVGSAQGGIHAFLDDAELEELMEDIAARERRRIPPGFQLPKKKKKKC